MFFGRFSRVRLIVPLINTRSSFYAQNGRILSQTRLNSSRPGLFTLDLDIDSDSGKVAQKNAQEKTETEKKPVFTDSNSEQSSYQVDNISRGSQNSKIVIDTSHQTEKSLFSDKTDYSAGGNDPDGLDDIFADIVFESKTDSENNADQIDSFFGDLLASHPIQNTRDELGDIADLNFNGDSQRKPESSKEGNTEKFRSVLTDEKELFDKIFATYSEPDVSSSSSSDKLQQIVLSNLQDSFTSVNSNATLDYGLDSRSQNRPKSHESLSVNESRAIEENTKEALKETLNFIEKLETRGEIAEFARETFHRFRGEFPKRTFYLHKLRKESSKAYLSRHKALSEEIRIQSEKEPQTPTLNVFTLPTIFNKIVCVLTEKHHDGALALSLFNLAKEDLHLYTVVCNQQTYNEMLKVYWLFYGKRSLCEIELIVVEMMNNGFSGDAKTFIILREILGTYYSMKSGQSNFSPGGAPIWSKEDERRARNLTQKLKILGRKLRKEQPSRSSERQT